MRKRAGMGAEGRVAVDAPIAVEDEGPEGVGRGRWEGVWAGG